MEKWFEFVRKSCIVLALIFVFNIPFLLITMSELSKRIADISFLVFIVGATIQAIMMYKYKKENGEDT